MSAILTVVLLIPLIVVVAPVCLYLLLLTAAAPFGARRTVRAHPPTRRFAVLVPAYNEEPVIGRLLASLQALDYPRELVDVYVVADNCTDGTEAVARGHGATVHIRQDPARPGKGAALNWLIEAIARAGERYDAYLIVDADSVVSANTLSALNDRLTAGAEVIQTYYTVLPLHGTRAESLRTAALALVHFARPAAKAVLGASAGLKGNGMCLAGAVIERFGWPSNGLAEDVECHLTLVRAGLRVAFAPEATVQGEMPSSLGGSGGQNLRWEAGRLSAARRQALPLLRQGLARRSFAVLDAAAEQLVPPLSIPVTLAVVCLAAGLAIGATPVWLMAAAMLTIIAAHVITGLLTARVPPRVYRALLYAPVYLAWKSVLYARALAGRHERRWVRTERAQTG
jgi:1,2-diacylglycerol 3-beta-glucosyltransferase